VNRTRALAAGWAFGAGFAALAASDELASPPGVQPGDAQRGRAIAEDRRVGLCTLCHQAPLPDPHLQGDIGPPLHGIGARLTANQLRLRVVDPKRLNPESVMPSSLRTEGRTRVAQRYAGQPLLDAQQIEDVVAWLQTLR
jgi:sulfur-oxidizing protein SoxX